MGALRVCPLATGGPGRISTMATSADSKLPRASTTRSQGNGTVVPQPPVYALLSISGFKFARQAAPTTRLADMNIHGTSPDWSSGVLGPCSPKLSHGKRPKQRTLSGAPKEFGSISAWPGAQVRVAHPGLLMPSKPLPATTGKSGVSEICPNPRPGYGIGPRVGGVGQMAALASIRACEAAAGSGRVVHLPQTVHSAARAQW